jgi:predicted enzyme related to lactoylglutathione lyase
MIPRLVEILYFVPDRMEAARWYADLFGSHISYLDDQDHFFIRVGSQEIWFHQADEKCPAGAAGQVAYWLVDDIDAMLGRALKRGATLYRGPLERLDGGFMCQVRDPFGNLAGFVGPRRRLQEEAPAP